MNHQKVLERAAKALKCLTREADHLNGCVAAVTHSTYLRILLGMILDEPLLQSTGRKVNNGGITVIDVKRDGSTRGVGDNPNFLGGSFSMVPRDFQLDIPICKVVRINEVRHLPVS